MSGWDKQKINRRFQGQIILALVLALICGQLTRVEVGWEHFGFHRILNIPVIGIYSFIGELFLRLLQMLIVPLIASAMITAMGSLAGEGILGRLGFKTICYYLSTTLLAVLTGLGFVNWIRPGQIQGETAKELLGLSRGSGEIAKILGEKGPSDLVEIFLRMVPRNVVEVASQNGQMLGVIFFSLLFGFFMTRLSGETKSILKKFWQGVYEIMLMITEWVMRFAPLGVFGLVAKVSASTAPQDFRILFSFFITVLLALAFHFFISLPLLLRGMGKINPWLHFRAIFPALLTAFSTSSSSATLPVTLDCLERRAKVSHRITSFVTPLGATVNMDGTALYECVAVIFIAQLYGVQLAFQQQFLIVILALLTSVGVAGIPSASLVAIMVILSSLKLPVEAIGILMVFDRLLDMCRTAVNVFSDTCGAVIIARTEGEMTVMEKSG
ncbi:MAG: dicarboxylate/amino acid:cation symporter [Verrucomicrobiae bacterium]|nr:dicarboxylate/amino acid:cation symporter [Verrucomicrobiae bacterium]